MSFPVPGVIWDGMGSGVVLCSCDDGKYARRPISRVLCPRRMARVTTIHLGRPLPDASRDRPGRLRKSPFRPRPESPWNRRPYLVLLPVGFTMPFPLPRTRCALTAPFHPYRPEDRRFAFCGTFPGVAPAGRYPAPCFLWSPDFPLRPTRTEAAVQPPSPLSVGESGQEINRTACRFRPG